jgi:hypothetical protein
MNYVSPIMRRCILSSIVCILFASTASAACLVPNKNIQLGNRDTKKDVSVAQLQQVLKQRYPETIVNGYFGPKTRTLVMRFQKEMKLPQTGKLGPQTREKLRQLCTAPKEPPQSCKVLFDGCNVCSRDVIGGPLRCTLRACADQKEQPSVCKEFFGVQASDVPSVKDGEVMCTKEYKPICGTPYSCLVNDLKDDVPRECTHGMTFGNKCTLDAQKGLFLHDGECAK